MSSSSKSTHDYSRKLRRAILEPWRQSHHLLHLLTNRNTPTCPSTINSSPSLSPPQNPSPNKITHLEINLQQAIDATNPSPPTSQCIPPPSLDQIKEGKRRSSAEEVFRKPKAAPHKSTFHRGPSPNDKITLRVGDDEVIFDVDQSIKIPSNEDDECYGIDDLDNTINAEAQELLVNDEPIVQEIAEPVKVEREHLYSASANEIKEKKPKLKDLPHHLEYAYLHGDKSFPIIISSELSNKEKSSLLQVLEKRKGAIAWKMSDINGISPSYCTHKIQMEDDFKSVIQPQRHLNPKVQDVVKNEIVKLLDSGLIYPISDSSWVSPIHVVPMKGGMTDSSKFQSHPKIKKRQHSHVLMGLLLTKGCLLGYDNAPASFQDACRQFFNDWWKTLLEVFLDGTLRISVISFYILLSAYFVRLLARCKETNLVLNWEKCHFMVKEGIVLEHKILGAGIEVDRAKIDVIAKLPYPTNVKGVRSFLGHAEFYQRFIKDFSMISKPMTKLLMKDVKFDFSDDCKKAFNVLKEKLTTVPIIISPDWNVPFELICDASDFTVGAVLGQRIDGKFKHIYYASKTLNNAQEHYTTTETELIAVVFSFDKFRPYLVLSKTIFYTNHSALKYLFSKQDDKLRLIRWVLLLQGFDIEIKDKRGAENLAADHLSRLENPDLGTFTEEETADEFLNEYLMVLKTELNNDEPCASVTGRNVYESEFFWPTIFKDAKDYVIKCDACQRSGNISSRSEIPQNNIQVCKVFDVWGLDFMGPFLNSKGNKYILVTVDYVSKWVEAQALPTNDARVVIKFLIRLFARFGVPKALIMYHPQTNGQTEVTNRAIKRILERSVGYKLKNWSKKLDDALWAFRAAYKMPTGCTPFRLVYGKACHVPVKIEHKAYWALKQCNMDLTTTAKNHFMELNELMELRDGAYKNTRI
ncbi:reverse transcriptase domain-containing protein [Tanacetum coccineum]